MRTMIAVLVLTMTTGCVESPELTPAVTAQPISVGEAYNMEYHAVIRAWPRMVECPIPMVVTVECNDCDELVGDLITRSGKTPTTRVVEMMTEHLAICDGVDPTSFEAYAASQRASFHLGLIGDQVVHP